MTNPRNKMFGLLSNWLPFAGEPKPQRPAAVRGTYIDCPSAHISSDIGLAADDPRLCVHRRRPFPDRWS